MQGRELALKYKTLRENICDLIRERIISKEMEPGSRIIEQNLSTEFGISRGPIREALRQLEQEGLIEYTRNAGCRVKSLTLEDVYEIYLLKSTYECLSIKESGPCFSAEELSEMEAVFRKMKQLTDDNTMSELIALDHDFHRIIVGKCNLPRLKKTWEDLSFGSYIAVATQQKSMEEIAKRQGEIHEILLEAIKGNDEEKTCEAIRAHYMDRFV